MKIFLLPTNKFANKNMKELIKIYAKKDSEIFIAADNTRSLLFPVLSGIDSVEIIAHGSDLGIGAHQEYYSSNLLSDFLAKMVDKNKNIKISIIACRSGLEIDGIIYCDYLAEKIKEKTLSKNAKFQISGALGYVVPLGEKGLSVIKEEAYLEVYEASKPSSKVSTTDYRQLIKESTLGEQFQTKLYYK